MKIFIFLILILILLLYFFTKSKNYKIVVARYNEDPWSWLPKDDYVIVYNKALGGDLPNIGREAHTYLTYIVENYDNLPDVVFFTQGAPDHTGGNSIEYFTNITGNCSQNFHVTKGPSYQFSDDGHLHWDVLDQCPMNFYDWFIKYVDENVDPRDDIVWYMGATFSVAKSKILSRSRDYYQNLLEQFPNHSNPELAHFFERSWYYIFNCHI